MLVTFGCGGGTSGPAAPSPAAPSQAQWVGLTPDGILAAIDPLRWCPAEYDLQLDLMTTGTTVTGTAITKLRKVSSDRCGDVFGQIATWTVTNGKAESGKISFGLAEAMTFSGTFTGTRMTGSFAMPSTGQTGSFVVVRP
jgi:hypothetical protein